MSIRKYEKSERKFLTHVIKNFSSRCSRMWKSFLLHSFFTFPAAGCEAFHISHCMIDLLRVWHLRYWAKKAVWFCCRRVMRSPFLMSVRFMNARWSAPVRSRFVFIRLHRSLMGFNQRQKERRRNELLRHFSWSLSWRLFVLPIHFSRALRLHKSYFENFPILMHHRRQISQNIVWTFIYQSNQSVHWRCVWSRVWMQI